MKSEGPSVASIGSFWSTAPYQVVFRVLYDNGAPVTVAAIDKFTAAPSALGYLYQCRYALLLLLDRMQVDPNAEIAVERFDDISFEKHGTPEELIQMKHHLASAPDLSDTSSDIWTTLRVWSHAISNGTATVPGTIFTIITTATCAPASAAILLKDGKDRDVNRAHQLLLGAASKMKGKTLKPARDAFIALGAAKQRTLLEATHVIDQSATIIGVVANIRKAIGFPVPTARIPAFIERLEGWWFSQVIIRLAGVNPNPISAIALGLEMDDLRMSFSADSLPVDFRHAAPPADDAKADRLFVRQLQLIALDLKNINWAKVDFFRAFAQRSRWLRDDLLNLTQLDNYDRLLTEEWERKRDWINKEAESPAAESEVIKRAKQLYWLLQEHCLPIRPKCVEPYVGRGSYQLLADRKLVGWHPNFLDLLNPVVMTSVKGESDASLE